MRTIPGVRRISGGCGIAAAACMLATGCGGGGAQSAASTPRAAVAAADALPTAPAMVMVTFTDRGYRASDVTVSASRPTMLMLVNEGARSHGLSAALPVADLEVDSVSSATAPAAPVAATSLIDVHVAGGDETDVTFTAVRAGRYQIAVDGTPAGSFVVTP